MSEESSTGIVRFAQSIDRGLAQLEKHLLAWAIILMAVNTIANVCARVGFSSSLFFSEELNQFLIVLVTFVGTSAAARQGRHIRMSAFTDLLPTEGRRRMLAVTQAVTSVVLAVLAWYAAHYIMRMYGLGRVTPALQMPMWITLLWIPLGLFTASLQFALACIVNAASSGSVYLAQHVTENDEVDMPTI